MVSEAPPELLAASFLACAFSCLASSSGMGMLLSAADAAEEVGGEDAVAAAPAGLSFFLVFFSCLEVGVVCKNVC